MAGSHTEDQIHHLSLVKQLWTVMKNVFSAAWTPDPAETILATILEHNHDISDARVKSIWSNLCSDLVTACDPAFLVSLCIQNEHRRETKLKRQLWTILAKVWQSSGVKFTWQDAVLFLAIPLE
jgi:hypothetical protein